MSITISLLGTLCVLLSGELFFICSGSLLGGGTPIQTQGSNQETNKSFISLTNIIT